MTKADIKKMSNNELIVDYVKTYSAFETNFVLRRGTERLAKHQKDLEEEMIRRNIFTEDDVRQLNM